MAKIITATLLLVILVDCFSNRTARGDKSDSVGFTRANVRSCRCSRISFGKMKCPFPLIPTYEGQKHKVCQEHQNVERCLPAHTDLYIPKEMRKLMHCLCCNLNIKRTPAMREFCRFSCHHPTPL